MNRSIALTLFVGALLGSDLCLADQSFDSNGTKIRYTISGQGPPVVLIHGFLGSSAEWTSPPPFLPPSQRETFQTIFESLSKKYRVIAPDCRGHGKSGKPTADNQYGLEMINDIVRLLDHLGIDDSHIVGYSMGAFIAAKLVESHPDRVKTVTLGGGGALLAGSEQLAFMLSLGQSLESGRGVEPLILAMMPPGQPKPTQKQLDQTNRMFLSNQNEKALSKVALGHQQLIVSQAKLKSNKVPVQLIVGGNDPLKAAAQETTKLLRHSKLVVLEGLDHISTEMSPKFLKHIQDFLNDH